MDKMSAESQSVLQLYNYSKKCADPFNSHETASKLKKGKKKRAIKADRAVREEDLSTPGLKKELTIGMMVCTNCHKKMQRNREPEIESSSESNQQLSSGEEVVPGPSTSSDVQFLPEDAEEVNRSLQVFEESPINRRRMQRSASYAREKAQKVLASVARTLQYMTPHQLTAPEQPLDTEKSDASEVIEQLKMKFQQCSSKNEKYMVLTTVPGSWSVNKIQQEFQVTNHQAKQAKKLQQKKGIMSIPEPRTGKKISNVVLENVLEFYRSDEISRQMSGKKDCVSVKDDGGRKVLKQKRLILSNLKEAYQCFKEKYPEHKISFSKFAELRPKECVLASSSGTHS